MPFGIIGRTGPGMRQVVGLGDRSTGRGTFGSKFGERHCNQWGLYGIGYLCDSAATRPSSQITLGRLVIIWMGSNTASLRGVCGLPVHGVEEEIKDYIDMHR